MHDLTDDEDTIMLMPQSRPSGLGAGFKWDSMSGEISYITAFTKTADIEKQRQGLARKYRYPKHFWKPRQPGDVDGMHDVEL